ncbi:hypothetical protein Hanom_Chr05g00436191 [Helianthus anomalus]
MYVTEDRLIMVEFVVIQKHVFILFISDSYMKEIQVGSSDGVYKFVILSLLYKTHTTLCRERPSEKGSRPTVFRRTPTFPTIVAMKNQAVVTICGLITGNQLHIYM